MAKALEWCIKHPEFKVELFRFIDVLPYLTSSDAVTRHFDEYFCGEGRLFRSGLQIGVDAVCHTPFLSRLAAREFSDNVKTMGRQFIAGETIDEAIPVIQAIRLSGLALSLDLLGEGCPIGRRGGYLFSALPGAARPPGRCSEGMGPHWRRGKGSRLGPMAQDRRVHQTLSHVLADEPVCIRSLGGEGQGPSQVDSAQGRGSWGACLPGYGALRPEKPDAGPLPKAVLKNRNSTAILTRGP